MYLQTHDEGEEVVHARETLFDVLTRTQLPADRRSDQAVNNPSKYETKAHLLSFGISQSRKSRRERETQGVDTRATTNANNSAYPELYACLCAYLDALALSPRPRTSCLRH